MLQSVPRDARLLGLAGLIPFVALTGCLVLERGLTTPDAWRALVLYAAVILSFMGGVHWGLALRGTTTTGYLTSVVPALVAWFAVVALPHKPAATVMAIGFLALLVYDLMVVRAGDAPEWYRGLRIVLTVVVVLSLGTALVAA